MSLLHIFLHFKCSSPEKVSYKGFQSQTNLAFFSRVHLVFKTKVKQLSVDIVIQECTPFKCIQNHIIHITCLQLSDWLQLRAKLFDFFTDFLIFKSIVSQLSKLGGLCNLLVLPIYQNSQQFTASIYTTNTRLHFLLLW